MFITKFTQKIIIIIAIIILLFPVLMNYNKVSAQSKCTRNYYISSIGSDRNDGLSETKAWKTIEKISQTHIKGGDCILLEGGKTFEGMVWINNYKDSSSSSSPITISSFGTGISTIFANGRPAIFIDNIGNVNIENINVVSNGSQNNTLNGIVVISDSQNIENIKINNVRVFGFGGFGLNIEVNNTGKYIKNISVTNSSFYQNGRAGLIAHGREITSIQKIILDNLFVFDNLGLPGKNYNTGDGIVLANTYDGKISNSRIFNNGIYCSASNCASGIMTYSSSKILIEKNFVYSNKTGSKNDGNGIDLDFDTNDSIVQYNYTYNNDGPGILVYDYTPDSNNTRNIIRYNLSYNDGKKSNMPNIAFGGYVHDIHLYNNTVYASNQNNNSPFQVWDWKGNNAKIENNIFYKNATNGYIVNIWNSNTANLNFSNNNYFSPTFGFRILWNHSYFDKLPEWQKYTAQDKFGIDSDPQLIGGFRLASTSPLYNKGKIILTNINDYFGYSVPLHGLPEIGFSELIR